jgi:hypothetical protein
MTLEELNAIIDRVVEQSVPNLGAAANVPIKTGRLRSAIKAEQTANGWLIYLDEGEMTLQEWEDMFPGGADFSDSPTNVAPYAEKVDMRDQYWIRVADILAMQIKSALGASVVGYQGNYNTTK